MQPDSRLSSTILESEEEDYGQFCILDSEEFTVSYQTQRPSSFYKWRSKWRSKWRNKWRRSKRELPEDEQPSSVYMLVVGGVLGVMILYVTLTTRR
jgi:hypothetical protein